MAKRKGRPKGEKDNVSAKMERQIFQKAKQIAIDQGVTTDVLLSNLLREPVEKLYRDFLRRIDKP